MCNIFSTGGKFWPVSNFTELHALTLAAHFYALLSYWPKSRSTQVSFPGLHLPVLQGLGTTLLVLMLVSCLDHMGRRLHSQLSISYVVSQLWRKITNPDLPLQSLSDSFANLPAVKQIQKPRFDAIYNLAWSSAVNHAQHCTRMNKELSQLCAVHKLFCPAALRFQWAVSTEKQFMRQWLQSELYLCGNGLWLYEVSCCVHANQDQIAYTVLFCWLLVTPK